MSETTPLLQKLLKKPNATFPKVISALCVIIITLGLLKYPNAAEIEFPGTLNVRLYTNNIRYDNKHPVSGERLWKHRKKYVSGSIGFNSINEANVVCLQEVLHGQLKDILHDLNSGSQLTFQERSYGSNDTDIDIFDVTDPEELEWNYYGIGRTDGIRDGEYSPILFKNREWAIVENKTFWLSETPETPSVGWDAALERIVTMVTLQSKRQPDITLNIFNTHFDHKGIKARRKSAELIVDKMENYNEYPSFLCGDFNTQPTDEPYLILTESGFKDSRILLPKNFGHNATFTGFDGLLSSIIDYIWAPGITSSDVTESSGWSIKIKHFGILANFYEYFMSDHRPVSADFEIQRDLFFVDE